METRDFYHNELPKNDYFLSVDPFNGKEVRHYMPQTVHEEQLQYNGSKILVIQRKDPKTKELSVLVPGEIIQYRPDGRNFSKVKLIPEKLQDEVEKTIREHQFQGEVGFWH